MEHSQGQSMLELSQQERDALVIVVLRTNCKETSKYAGPHGHSWKKMGLSRAYYAKEVVCEERMPTTRGKAAFRFLRAHNRFYYEYLRLQRDAIESGSSLNISSYDLFVVQKGMECAMVPWLYPTTDFTDTGILQHYMHQTGDNTNRTVSIGLSWTRKVLSSARVYGERSRWHHTEGKSVSP